MRNLGNFLSWVDQISEVKVVGEEVEVPESLKSGREDGCKTCGSKKEHLDELLEEVEHIARKTRPRLRNRRRKLGEEEEDGGRVGREIVLA